MERLMPAQTSEPNTEITCYQYFSSKGSKNDNYKLCDLSRNVLIVICEYLAFFEIVALTTSNKKIRTKLDNFLEPCHEVSYFKRRAIINLQSFFFEQFPSTEVFFKRMSSITSTSTMTSSTTSSFLPLTKQSSLCIQNSKKLPIFSKQLSSCNPFEMAMDVEFNGSYRKQLLEKIDDNKTSNYIDETYRKWRDLYIQALQNKNRFIEQTQNEFYYSFVQQPEIFAREIFLDPSLCENPTFALPQLTRETYTQKGLFYRTEKILVQGFQNCFTKYSVDYTKQILWEINEGMQNLYVESENFKQVIFQLLHGKAQAESDISHSTTLTSTTQIRSSSAQFPQCSIQEEDDVGLCCKNKSRSDALINNLMPDPLDLIDINEDEELELALASLQNLKVSTDQKQAKMPSISPFDSCITSQQQKSGGINNLYFDTASYTIRQFQLLCNAHNQQLNFILQQINMAPPQKQNFYIYLEDYIVKEKNLKFLLKKVTQNFIVQESFCETLIKQGIVSQNLLNKHPYYCDFMLLEILDSIWMNETYRKQRDQLIQFTKKEISAVHCVDRIHELFEKKETFRKIINLIHQMEFNLENEAPFLQATNSSNSFKSKSDDQAKNTLKYKDLEMHLRKTVRQMLKSMQRCSHSVNEFVQLCSRYESYEFHKIQELEYYYIVTKKHYLSKAFSHELSIKLENNKFQKSQIGSGSSSTVPGQNCFMDLNLNQIIPSELINSFFHQLIRNLLKEVRFKEFMESDQFMQSLFVLFHIDQQSKSNFTVDLNQYMVEFHQQLENLRREHPVLYGDESINEEMKQCEMIYEKVGYPTGYDNSFSGPFTLIASDEDDDLIEPTITPELNRGYSDQKRQYQKAFRSVVFQVFQKTEEDFDFKNMIEKMRQEEHKRMVEQMQASINNFNQSIQQRAQQQQINNVQQQQLQQPQVMIQSQNNISPPLQNANLQMPSLQSLPDLDDLDEEDLPDPSMLMGSFSSEPRQQSQSLTNDFSFNNNLLIGPGMGGLNMLGNYPQIPHHGFGINQNFEDDTNFQITSMQSITNSKFETKSQKL